MFTHPVGPVLNRQARWPRRAAYLYLRPEQTAGEAFQAIATGCLERFRADSARLGISGDAEALHRSRVALRQLRSAFSIFEPVVHDLQFEPQDEGLGWLGAAMNETRDLDTLIARYEDPPATLVRARRRALAHAIKALGSVRARRLLRDVAEWLDHGIWIEVRNPPDLVMAEFAPRSLDRLWAKLGKKARHVRPDDDRSIHKLRISAKKLRYGTEFFAGLFTGPKAEQREQDFKNAMRKLQDSLGELRDLAMASALLDRFEVPEQSRPALPSRAQLLKRAMRQLEHVLDCKPYWT